MNIRKISSEKIILGLGLLALLFLLLLYLNNHYFHFDFVLIGVFQELLTIPCILLQPLLLLFSIRGLYKKKFKENKYAYAAIAILTIGILFSVSMFISV
ncbi:hypothetical protein [Lacinutrix jangbogonensis]|uniref:hypothetical protein n=1 Tax=Lacinutrix jangbogonensis TaxID=1469557 RepID=UPI0012E08917|nr:hypothetical protein [Lacinutrix jangbogonensis]